MEADGTEVLSRKEKVMSVVFFDHQQLLIVGNKIYSVCPYCEHFIRVNKPILGGLHFCLNAEEREKKEKILNEQRHRNNPANVE